MYFNEFVKKYEGVYGIPNPTNSAYALRGQCVSLARAYMVEVLDISLNNIYGNAKDYWFNFDNLNLKRYFIKLPYKKGFKFQKGDVFVTNAVPSNKYGHIGLCYGESDDSFMKIFDSNYMNKKTCMTRSRQIQSDLLGVLRPIEQLQHKIADENLIGIEDEYKFIEPNAMVHIRSDLKLPHYNVRNKVIDGEIIYKAKADDYLDIVSITDRVLKDGFKWAKVITYGGDEGYIQVDLEHIEITA